MWRVSSSKWRAPLSDGHHEMLDLVAAGELVHSGGETNRCACQWCPCRKLTLGYIGGAARPILARPTPDRRSGRHGGSARPSAMTSVCAPRCSIFDTSSEGNEDAARRTQLHGQDSPAGSIRLASPHIHSATVSVR